MTNGPGLLAGKGAGLDRLEDVLGRYLAEDPAQAVAERGQDLLDLHEDGGGGDAGRLGEPALGPGGEPASEV